MIYERLSNVAIRKHHVGDFDHAKTALGTTEFRTCMVIGLPNSRIRLVACKTMMYER